MKTSKNIKKILLNYYSTPMINRILRGERKPSYEMMITLQETHKIPFTAWKDIKSFITDSVTSNEKIEKD